MKIINSSFSNVSFLVSSSILPISSNKSSFLFSGLPEKFSHQFMGSGHRCVAEKNLMKSFALILRKERKKHTLPTREVPFLKPFGDSGLIRYGYVSSLFSHSRYSSLSTLHRFRRQNRLSYVFGRRRWSLYSSSATFLKQNLMFKHILSSSNCTFKSTPLDLVFNAFPGHVYNRFLFFGVERVCPTLEVRSLRLRGRLLRVPFELAPSRQATLALRWIFSSVKEGRGFSFVRRLAEELFYLSERKESKSEKKRDDMHRMVESYRAFSHIRW
uniref:Ribosomal protein S7 n=1 Tax=Goniomonas avonlea TaxID=1255295 RepID=A0A348G6L6_9CRYP|nr:ribosomal protein S7 [Goniomonas avonlea]